LEGEFSHSKLIELDLICHYREPFEWNPSKLPQLRLLRLRLWSKRAHDSTLPILAEATMRVSSARSEDGPLWRQQLEQLRQAPMRPRITIQADGSSLPMAVHAAVTSGLPVAAIISEGDSSRLPAATYLNIPTLERLVLHSPPASVLQSLYALPMLRALSVQRTLLQEDDFHALLSLAEAGCRVFLLN
jgi:hypothetical protein